MSEVEQKTNSKKELAKVSLGISGFLLGGVVGLVGGFVLVLFIWVVLVLMAWATVNPLAMEYLGGTGLTIGFYAVLVLGLLGSLAGGVMGWVAPGVFDFFKRKPVPVVEERREEVKPGDGESPSNEVVYSTPTVQPQAAQSGKSGFLAFLKGFGVWLVVTFGIYIVFTVVVSFSGLAQAAVINMLIFFVAHGIGASLGVWMMLPKGGFGDLLRGRLEANPQAALSAPMVALVIGLAVFVGLMLISSALLTFGEMPGGSMLSGFSSMLCCLSLPFGGIVFGVLTAINRRKPGA